MRFTGTRILEFIYFSIVRPHHDGHGIHSPFLFDFVTHTLYEQGKDDDQLKDVFRLRNELLTSRERIFVEDYGAGSKAGNSDDRKVSEIVRVSSTASKYCKLLFRIVRHLQPEIVIELGTSLGFGTMSMAAGNKKSKIHTIEGSFALLNKAHENFSALNFTNIIEHNGIFEDVLPSILKENGRFDVMFIDGNHRKDAVLKYFNDSLPYTHDHSVIIIDDIRWSAEMYESWLEICKHNDVRISLDLFHWGIIFFNKKIIKQHFKIYY